MLYVSEKKSHFIFVMLLKARYGFFSVNLASRDNFVFQNIKTLQTSCLQKVGMIYNYTLNTFVFRFDFFFLSWPFNDRETRLNDVEKLIIKLKIFKTINFL